MDGTGEKSVMSDSSFGLDVNCQDLLVSIEEFEKTTCKPSDNNIDNNMDCASSESCDQQGASSFENEDTSANAQSKTLSINNTKNISEQSTIRRIDCTNGKDCERHVCPECGMTSRDSGLKFCGKPSCIDNEGEGVRKCSLKEVVCSLMEGDKIHKGTSSLTKSSSSCRNTNCNVDKVAKETVNKNISAAKFSAFQTNSLFEPVSENLQSFTDCQKVNEELSTTTLTACGQKRTFDSETGVGLDISSTKVVRYQGKTEINDAEHDTLKLFKIKTSSSSPENRQSKDHTLVKVTKPEIVSRKSENSACTNLSASGLIFESESESIGPILCKRDNVPTDSSKVEPEICRPQKFKIHSSTTLKHNTPDYRTIVSTFEGKNESEDSHHALLQSHICGAQTGDSANRLSLDSENDAGYPLHASQGSLDLRENVTTTSCNTEPRNISDLPICHQSETFFDFEKLHAARQLLPSLQHGKEDHLKFFDSLFGPSTSSTCSYYEPVHIDCLYVPLILRIFSFLSLYDVLLRASLVCKKWLAYTKDSALWRTVDLSEQIKVDNCVLSELTSRSDRVIHLDITDSKLVTNEGLTQVLARCPHLRTLKIVRCHQLSGEGLKSIGRFCLRLTDLWMDNCYGLCDDSLKVVGESGLRKVVENCPELEELSLMSCDLSDQTVCFFTRLKNLRKLDISNNGEVSKTTIMEIAKKCSNLSVFGLSMIQAVDDECLDVVAKSAQNLERLHLVSCNLSDEALESLGRHCKKLNSLDVGWCGKITDSGVRKISELCPLLTYLGLIRCDTVTAEAIEELMTCYPAVKYSTFKLESHFLLERACREGFITEEAWQKMKSQSS